MLFSIQCLMYDFKMNVQCSTRYLVGGGWWVRWGFSFVEFLMLIVRNVQCLMFASGWRLVGKKGRKNSSPVSLPRYVPMIEWWCMYLAYILLIIIIFIVIIINIINIIVVITVIIIKVIIKICILHIIIIIVIITSFPPEIPMTDWWCISLPSSSSPWCKYLAYILVIITIINVIIINLN